MFWVLSTCQACILIPVLFPLQVSALAVLLHGSPFRPHTKPLTPDSHHFYQGTAPTAPCHSLAIPTSAFFELGSCGFHQGRGGLYHGTSVWGMYGCTPEWMNECFHFISVWDFRLDVSSEHCHNAASSQPAWVPATPSRTLLAVSQAHIASLTSWMPSGETWMLSSIYFYHMP